VNHFCNARNAIPYIKNIEIINAFHDGVRDIKTVEEIAVKKYKMVVDLLTVVDTCVEAFEAWAQLLESRGNGHEEEAGRPGSQHDLPRRSQGSQKLAAAVLGSEREETFLSP
jgi:hypothetical protein